MIDRDRFLLPLSFALHQPTLRLLYHNPDFPPLLTLMRNRILAGEFRYGMSTGRWLHPDDRAQGISGVGFGFCLRKPESLHSCLRAKTSAYLREGNGDLLPDIANYAMFLLVLVIEEEAEGGEGVRGMRAKAEAAIAGSRRAAISLIEDCAEEFARPSHPRYHFSPLDQSSSPIASGRARFRERRYFANRKEFFF